MTAIEAEYSERFRLALTPLAQALEGQLKEYLVGQDRIDRITARPKGISKFLAKASIQQDGQPKYAEPFRQIQDQIGARIVTFYLSDVVRIAQIVERYFRPIESRLVIPDSESEFGYFGRHYIFLMPNGLLKPAPEARLIPDVFELQIKTLFQHAWSEANHDLGYKPGGKVPAADQKRLLAYASAQSWGADRVFDELFRNLQASGSS